MKKKTKKISLKRKVKSTIKNRLEMLFDSLCFSAREAVYSNVKGFFFTKKKKENIAEKVVKSINNYFNLAYSNLVREITEIIEKEK